MAEPEIQIDMKQLNGSLKPNRQVLAATDMIADPKPEELENLGNPIDYFNIYKNKMKDLAKVRFERDKDVMFFNYLDRLVDPEKFEEEDRERAKAKGARQVNALREFVIDDDSLSQMKKRNEIARKWEKIRLQRLKEGGPEYEPQPTAEELEYFLDTLKKRTLKQKTFRPEGLVKGGKEEIDADVAGNLVKDYAVKDRFGNNRDFRPAWKDPNPIKYGGPHGMQRLKELSDTAYYREKNADEKR